jgi:gliding motility-associated-like protein
MKKSLQIYFFFSAFILLNISSAIAQRNWKNNPFESKAFIENKGQFYLPEKAGFNSKIVYGNDGHFENHFLTPSGVAIVLESMKKRVKSEEEKAARAERRKQGFYSHKDWQEFEKAGTRLDLQTDILYCTWVNANPNPQIVATEKNGFTHAYSFYDAHGKLTDVSGLSSYKKITYINLYPNIDVVYELHPESGIKYSIILHPGADPSLIQLNYSKNIVLGADGKIRTNTAFGEIIDHMPVTFYGDNHQKKVSSSYVVNGNTIGFRLGNYDNTKTLIIDPWTQSPTFNTNWDCVWECETDASGNSYIIGGVMPLQLIKYNSAGVQQWIYNTPYDTTSWLGTFATDNAGNSYVTNGSSAAIVKVTTAGAISWNNPSPGGLFSLTEFWNIAFNCDQTKLVIGGTGGTLNPEPFVYDIDVNTGNVISSIQVTGPGALFGIPPNTNEVRAITATENDKYYFLTHDSIGFISSDLSLCGTSSSPFHIVNDNYNLSYKCENWRYDNTGIEAMAYYDGFVYVNRGTRLDKINATTALVVATTPIPGGGFAASLGQNQVQNSGIAIDNCGNIFVGSKTGVYKFNTSLTQLTNFATTFNVYDVAITSTGEVIAAGSTGNSSNASRTGSVQSFAAAACAQQPIVCCDPSVCPPGNLCVTDAPITLTPSQSGGTWSGTGVNAAGVFNPTTAGAGTHTITYTLPCGSETVQITVSPCTALSVCQEANGTLTVSNGTGPYTWQYFTPAQTVTITNSTQCTSCGYTWTFGQCLNGFIPVTSCTVPATWTTFSTNTNSGTLPGTFPIQVTDNSGTVFTINSLAGIAPCSGCPTITTTISSVVNVNCFGQSTGSFSATASGGTGPYDYVLMNGATTVATFNNITGAQSFTGLAAGTYTINVTDANNCTGTITQTITQPTSAVSVTISGTTQATCGNSNGTATASGTGGTGTISYAWNTTPAQSTATATGLAAGTYTVTATDANGCQATATATITSSGGPTVSIASQTNVLCFGGTTGTATASASGGSGTISYSWNTTPAQSGATATGLSAGTYTVTATDANGCSGTTTVTITQPANAVSVNISSTTPANCGTNDGSATALGSGGTGTITYSWNTTPVQTGATASNLAAGSFTVTATDANGCQATAIASVSNTNAPTITLVSSTNVTCNGDTDGSATVSSSGGTGTLTTTWNTSPAQSGNTANNLGAGTYVVTVTDASGCSATQTVTITQPNAITVSTSSTPANCGAADGSATATASGGTGTLNYSWNTTPTQSTATASNIVAGSYTVTVTDASGCSNTANAVVGTVSTANISAGADEIIVAGDSVQLNATGGTVYTWTPATDLSCTTCSNPYASPTVTTAYIVTGTDANGCVGTDTVIVIVDAPCGNIFVPSAFSPNGDGENDVLRVYGNCINELYFVIYDRWGEKVFETTNPSLTWDGTLREKAMNGAVFFYYISASLSNGEVYEGSGNITLFR